jgi:RimJ/RimL family protein N-acetyltransferase
MRSSTSRQPCAALSAPTHPLGPTGTLALSPLEDSDRLALVKHLREPEIARRTLRIPFPYTEIDAQRWIGLARARNRQFGRTLVWAIREEGSLIGCVGFEIESHAPHKAELGYWLARPYWGRGIMTGVVQKAVQIGMSTYGWTRLSAHVFDFNTASARVLEKSGFVLEAVLRRFYFRSGQYYDAKLYAQIAKD